MTEKKNNGDFLRCVQELEATVPDELRPVWRKVAVHVVSLEQEVQRLKDDHTDPATGEPFDVRGAYASLGEVIKLGADVRRAIAWGQAALALGGILVPIILGLGMYIWHEAEQRRKEDTARVATIVKQQTEQSQAMERMLGALNVLAVRLDHLEEEQRRR
jgi:uncharacterized iron-regulated membrane protein